MPGCLEGAEYEAETTSHSPQGARQRGTPSRGRPRCRALTGLRTAHLAGFWSYLWRSLPSGCRV